MDGLEPKSLQSLSEYAKQLIEVLGEEDDDKELSFPDILTVRGSIAVLSDTVQYEATSFPNQFSSVFPIQNGHSEEDMENIMNGLIPVDLVYIKSEMDPTAIVDAKIALCNRRIVKSASDSEVLSEQEGGESIQMQDSSEMEEKAIATKSDSITWKLNSFNLSDWVAEQASKIMIEEEG